jgi:hypothetical protein
MPSLPLARDAELLHPESLLPVSCVLRPCKYLNDVLEQNHRFVTHCGHAGLGFGFCNATWRAPWQSRSKALQRVIDGKLSALNGAMQHGNTEPLAVMYITVQGRIQRAHGRVSTIC